MRRAGPIAAGLVLLMILASCSRDFRFATDQATLGWLEGQGMDLDALEAAARDRGFRLDIRLTGPGAVQNVVEQAAADRVPVMVAATLRAFAPGAIWSFPPREDPLPRLDPAAPEALREALRSRAGVNAVAVLDDGSQISLEEAGLLASALEKAWPGRVSYQRVEDISMVTLGSQIAGWRASGTALVMLSPVTDTAFLRELSVPGLVHAGFGLPLRVRPWSGSVATFHHDLGRQLGAILAGAAGDEAPEPSLIILHLY